MIDAVRLSPRRDSHPEDTSVPPLSGYLVTESEQSLRVRVSDGIWTFDRADILAVERADRTPADSGEKPVRVRIRPGTTADFTRRVRIELTERPMTVPREHSPARGDDMLARLTEKWARGLQLATTRGVGGATFTYCQTRTDARSDDGTACDSLD
ncbi:hypothetical protein [Nocardia transvalensis]|uniref:hypothetical protein n=1 Tax=Nocardia transvalensis TaxID=37333 RepID=UPI001893FC1A|nr:hypothetical protein [Nocardia transvalensis]MBF6331210.1 hypothetical protein [Nocardia transvalensis]